MARCLLVPVHQKESLLNSTTYVSFQTEKFQSLSNRKTNILEGILKGSSIATTTQDINEFELHGHTVWIITDLEMVQPIGEGTHRFIQT